jgi:hypothetical protein
MVDRPTIYTVSRFPLPCSRTETRQPAVREWQERFCGHAERPAELVRRLDGRIWVEANDGKGSMFIVELPATPASAQRPQKTAA